MLPKCVLCPPPRGGRAHANAAAAFTCDRLSRWIAGERLSLWDSCTTPSLQRVKMSKQHKQSLAMSLVREGFDKKACSTLTAEGLVEPTRAALDKLRPLHPSAPPPSVSSIHMLPPGPSFDSDAVLEALRGFPRDSAPGPFWPAGPAPPGRFDSWPRFRRAGTACCGRGAPSAGGCPVIYSSFLRRCLPSSFAEEG